MAGSPPCTSCGRRALRYRKRTDDFVCRRCGASSPVLDVRFEALAAAQLRRSRRSGRQALQTLTRSDLTGRREVAVALAEMEAAAKQLDVAVQEVIKRHDPTGCLPVALAVLTAAIVAGVALRSVRWYFAVLLSIGGGAVTFLVLLVFRLLSWSKHHPLLAKMYRLRHDGQELTTNDEFVELSEAIVEHYLAPEQSASILARLEETRTRTAILLGLDKGEADAVRRASV